MMTTKRTLLLLAMSQLPVHVRGAGACTWGIDKDEFVAEYRKIPKRPPISQDEFVEAQWKKYEDIQTQFPKGVFEMTDDIITDMGFNKAMEEVAEDLKARVNSVELFHKLFRTKNGLCPICGTPGSGVDCCYVDYETINREYSTLCDIFWEDAPKCECATNKWPCTKCGHEFSEAYDAGKCTRCTTGRATVGRCARCQDRPGVERHQCRSGRNCPCLGQKTDAKCPGKEEKCACTTNKQCIPCAYDADNCTRCFTSSKWTCTCDRCHGSGRELHECNLGHTCPCLGERNDSKCRSTRRRLAPRYRDSPVLLRLLQEIRAAQARHQAKERARA